MNRELEIKLHLNRGFCHWKLRNYSLAIDDFSDTIDLLGFYNGIPVQDRKKYQLKAYIRRAICLEYVSEFKRSFQDLQTAMTIDVKLLEHDLSLQSLYQRTQQYARKDDLRAAQEGTLAWMAHAHQSLRLNLLRTLPTCIQLHEIVTCKIGLGNELGLFDRRLFQANSSSSRVAGLTTNLLRVICNIVPFKNISLPSEIRVTQIFPSTECLLQTEEIFPETIENTKSLISGPVGEDGKVNVSYM
jgi:hypothetical protein